MPPRAESDALEGLLLVDKPQGLTSHDVVARVRRLAGTRRVGHAGTLDPMATGLLVLGVGRATRLLGHLALTDKEYLATMRLGSVTSTDDAEGETTSEAGVPASVGEQEVDLAARRLTGSLQQVPPAVSAIKVDGKRAYARTRAGEQLVMVPRQVTVAEFEVREVRRLAAAGSAPAYLDVDARVVCSSGTYIRALARDLGDLLGVGGHLAALRRTRTGPYLLSDAVTLDELLPPRDLTPLAVAAEAAFPCRRVDAVAAQRLAHGLTLAVEAENEGMTAILGPDGRLVALVEESEGVARPRAVFA